MGSLRKRGTKYSFTFKWKGRQEIRALGTTSVADSKRIKAEAEAQLDRIRRGQSPVASRLLVEGYSIIDVLFGSEKVAARLAMTTDDNPYTVEELSEGYLTHLKTTVNFDQQANSESWMKKVRGHLGDDRRVMSLADDDLTTYAHRRTNGDGVGSTSVLKELGSLRAAIRWAIRNKKLPSDPITKWPSLKTKRQRRFEWKSDIEATIKCHAFDDEREREKFLHEMKARMVLTGVFRDAGCCCEKQRTLDEENQKPEECSTRFARAGRQNRKHSIHLCEPHAGCSGFLFNTTP